MDEVIILVDVFREKYWQKPRIDMKKTKNTNWKESEKSGNLFFRS